MVNKNSANKTMKYTKYMCRTYNSLTCFYKDENSISDSVRLLNLWQVINPAGDHWAEFGPRDQCKSCAGRNSAGFGMTL